MGKRILITGANGYIGRGLAQALSEKEWVERIVGIDIKGADSKYPKYCFIERDVREPVDDIIKGEGIDTIAHMAWILPPIHDKSLMEDINKEGTKNILDASVRGGVRHLLYTSSTTAYGFHPDNDFPLTEESPLRGNDDFTYSKNKKEIEGVMARFSDEHPEITLTILRPSFVVGPGFKNPLATHLRKKLVMILRKGAPFQYVHEDDLLDVMLLVLKGEKGGIYNVAGEGTITFVTMIRMLGNIPIRLPFPLIYPLNNVAWYLRLKFLTEFPSTGLNMMRYPWIASSEKLISETGYKFKYDTMGAFKDFARYVRGDS